MKILGLKVPLDVYSHERKEGQFKKKLHELAQDVNELAEDVIDKRDWHHVRGRPTNVIGTTSEEDVIDKRG